jgi:hypothetical protein
MERARGDVAPAARSLESRTSWRYWQIFQSPLNVPGVVEAGGSEKVPSIFPTDWVDVRG